MKKLSRDKLEFLLRAGQKREYREKRANIKRRKKSSSSRKRSQRDFSFNLIHAPTKLDLYSPKNHNVFVGFLDTLRKSVKTYTKTVISFRDSHRITASAGLMIVAETDRLLTAFPGASVRCSFPSKAATGKYGASDRVVEASLNQIGLFKLIGQRNNLTSKQADINMWRQLSGQTADGSLASSLLESIGGDMSDIVKKKIYRGAIEAIANCVEHAYPYPRKDGMNLNDNRWWMLVGKDDANLCIIVCDLGVGIPETLPKKHPTKLLDQIKSRFGISDNSDSELIRASTHLKQTRTQLSNRGKGGKDFRSITRNFPTASLIIRSNKGAFFIEGEHARPLPKASTRRFVPDTGRKESTVEHALSIHGTLIEWVVPLQDLEK